MVSGDAGQPVLLLLDQLGAGGAERVVLNLASAFVELGFRPHLVTISPGGAYPVAAGVAVHELGPVWPRKLRVGLWAHRLRNLVSRIERTEGTLALCLSNLETSDRVVVRSGLAGFHHVLHNPLSADIAHRRVITAFFKRMQLRRRYRGRSLVGVSQGVIDDAVTAVGVGASHVAAILNPVNVDAIRSAARASTGYQGRDYIVHVGRFSAQKRHDCLLEGYARAGIAEDLVLLGLGEMQGDIEGHVSQLGLQGRVHLVGFLENPFPIVKHARLLVLCSDYEGLSCAIQEALVLGTPVLACGCHPGPRELLEAGGGFLFPDNHPATVAEGLRLLSGDGARRVSPVSESFLRGFEPPAVARRYLALPSAT